MIRPKRSARVGDRCSPAPRDPPRCVAVFSTRKGYLTLYAVSQRHVSTKPRSAPDHQLFFVGAGLLKTPRLEGLRLISTRLRLTRSPVSAHNIGRALLRRNATQTAITRIPTSGTRNPIGKLFALVDTNPTNHGIAEPPNDAIEKTTPPRRRAAGPYQCENHDM